MKTADVSAAKPDPAQLEQKVLRLKKEGFTVAEIGHVLDVSPSMVLNSVPSPQKRSRHISRSRGGAKERAVQEGKHSYKNSYAVSISSLGSSCQGTETESLDESLVSIGQDVESSNSTGISLDSDTLNSVGQAFLEEVEEVDIPSAEATIETISDASLSACRAESDVSMFNVPFGIASDSEYEEETIRKQEYERYQGRRALKLFKTVQHFIEYLIAILTF
ncbi:hypothetical protein J8273_4458 [Carpediemonas membranifera]|uniref:Uncharacterized protein n=1 Tax=Carpediemonas membranifera TaxID=201153 RepID=A0A8J6AXQ7_9EUKA|nr:hypothetical protein J8273_4458 [Carpediemonas membranifera]|eukprot:KAG9394095.1 hypothetical protein J8273_4458 [Carpediemonas membranifera]